MLLCLNARNVSFASSGLSSTSRMVLLIWSIFRFLHTEEKRCSLAFLRLSPDFPVVPANDPLDARQTNPGAGKIVSVVQALEGAEKVGRVRHVETHAVVSDEIHLLGVAFQRTDADHRLVRAAGKLPGVLEQVLHGDAHQRRGGADAQPRLYYPLHGPVGRISIYGSGDLARDRAQVDLRKFELGARHLGQPEQVV